MAHAYAIVGGGIYGAGTAWELARAGADVVLFEGDEIAAGASGGLGKRGVRANGRDPRELPLMARAYDRWPALADEIGADTGYERTGHLLLYEREAGGGGGYASAPARRWAQEGAGVSTELLDAEAVREYEPAVSDAVIGALSCPKDGVADHAATTRGLADAAAREGATVHEGTRVVDAELDGGRVTAVRTADGERFAVEETLLVLANAGVRRFAAEAFDVTLPVWEVWPQVIRTEPLAEVPVRHLIGHDSRTLAMKALPGDRVMISGGWRGEAGPDGTGLTVPERVAANVREAVATYPSLEGVGVEAADAGRPESVTVDGVPIVDRVPGTDNALVAAGWSGHGFAISLAVNELLCEWARSGERPSLLEPFAYDRFGDPGG